MTISEDTVVSQHWSHDESEWSLKEWKQKSYCWLSCIFVQIKEKRLHMVWWLTTYISKYSLKALHHSNWTHVITWTFMSVWQKETSSAGVVSDSETDPGSAAVMKHKHNQLNLFCWRGQVVISTSTPSSSNNTGKKYSDMIMSWYQLWSDLNWGHHISLKLNQKLKHSLESLQPQSPVVWLHPPTPLCGGMTLCQI